MAMRITREERNERNDRLEDVKEAHAAMVAAIAAYNDAVGEVLAWRDGVADRLDNEWYDASERWQNGENGERARDWIDLFQGLEIEEADDVNELDVNDWRDHPATPGA